MTPHRRFDGSRLLQARKAARKTREQVAVDVGRSASLVCLIELGDRGPTPEVLDAMCRSLGISIDDRFDEVPA